MVLQLALPKNESRPSKPAKLAKVFRVPHSISRDLILPVIQVRLGHSSEPTLVPMPKAAMHEDQFMSWSKNQIRFAWQILPVKTVSIAQVVNEMTHSPFWLGVFRSNQAHLPASQFRRHIVHGQMKSQVPLNQMFSILLLAPETHPSRLLRIISRFVAQ